MLADWADGDHNVREGVWRRPAACVLTVAEAHIGRRLRARAGRSGGWAPAVSPFDEFDGDDECDGERDLVEAVVDEAVGVAA